MALVGWILEIEALRSVIPDHVSMKANTAIGIGVAGVAVGIAAAQPVGSPAPALVKVLGGGALAIGLVTLVEYAFDWGTWFDELLFDDPDARSAPRARDGPPRRRRSESLRPDSL
jgi:hypothetical protein